ARISRACRTAQMTSAMGQKGQFYGAGSSPPIPLIAVELGTKVRRRIVEVPSQDYDHPAHHFIRPILGAMKDAEDPQLILIARNLVHDDVRKSPNEPFSRSRRSPKPSGVRKVL